MVLSPRDQHLKSAVEENESVPKVAVAAVVVGEVKVKIFHSRVVSGGERFVEED